MSQENEVSPGTYREAIAPYLGAERLEVVGRFVGHDPWLGGAGDVVGLFELVESLYHSARGRRVHRLPPSFLLAVTRDEVHFFKYRRKDSEVEIQQELLRLDRDAIRFKVLGKAVYFAVSEGDHTTTIDIDRKSLEEQGAAAVAAALSE